MADGRSDVRRITPSKGYKLVYSTLHNEDTHFYIPFFLSTVVVVSPPWIETTQHRSVPLHVEIPIQRHDPLDVK